MGSFLSPHNPLKTNDVVSHILHVLMTLSSIHNMWPTVSLSLAAQQYVSYSTGDELMLEGESRKKILNWKEFLNIIASFVILAADVTLAETTRYPIPIMAHPPLNMSDITLDDWLLEVLRSESGKGIKLDFKSTRVVEPAFRVLARHSDFLKGPLVLNADVLPGVFLWFCRIKLLQLLTDDFFLF